MRLRYPTNAKPADGFTILEVLIALAASLFLMLGLTRAFKLIGDRITESQSELELSSTLRDVSYRLRDELRRATSHMSPPGKSDAGDGYLVYHEGPFTDATTILGDPSAPGSPDYYPTSRYGDIDDYLAFTAEAEPGSPFVGFIPAGILEAHRFANSIAPSDQDGDGDYDNQDAATRVPFYSRRAEIAYWLAPRWARTAGGGFAYDSGSGYPLYPDDGDQLPDRLDLHRRVLLIRNDLNMTPAEMNQANGDSPPSPTPPDWHVPQLPILVATSDGPEIRRLTDWDGGNRNFFDGSTPLVAPGLWTASPNTNAPNWLTGIARLQQAMDLSVSRVTNHWADPQQPGDSPTMYGQPSGAVEANSLAGLSRPENRFAHVRMPEALVSGMAGSTLPQLALAPPHPYLTVREDVPPYFPAQADHNIGSNGPGPGSNDQFKYGRFAMVGFLRPEFCLNDVISDSAAGGSNSVAINRGGSDIVATNLLSFNLQIFDEAAPKYVWYGDDQSPGTSGDDDGDGDPAPDLDELGYPNSDDELVTLNGLRMSQVLTDVPSGSKPPPGYEFYLVDRGDFVDLNYTRSAGGAMGSLIQLDGSDPPSQIGTSPLKRGHMVGQISGLGDASTNAFPESWQMSGRFVISRGSGVPTVSSFYQPVFDTWTNDYGRDAFDQEGRSTTTSPFAYKTLSTDAGTLPAYDERRGDITAPRSVQYRHWSSFEGGSTNPGFAGTTAGLNTSTAGSNEPIEVEAPIQGRLKALKISIRAFDAEAGQIRQQTIIEDF